MWFSRENGIKYQSKWNVHLQLFFCFCRTICRTSMYYRAHRGVGQFCDSHDSRWKCIVPMAIATIIKYQCRSWLVDGKTPVSRLHNENASVHVRRFVHTNIFLSGCLALSRWTLDGGMIRSVSLSRQNGKMSEEKKEHFQKQIQIC